MIRTKREAIAGLRTLGLPDVFFRIWTREVPHAIYDVCSPPVRFFDLLQEGSIRLTHVSKFIPFWEENLEAIVGFDGQSGQYIRHHYTKVLSDEVLGSTYQKFVTVFFVELIDSGVFDELDDLSEVFSYRYLDLLKTFAENTSDSTWYRDLRVLLASID